VKGTNLIGLVKILKNHRKQHPFVVSMVAEALLAEHIILTNWYPYEVHSELIWLTFREILQSKAESALGMGIVGGTHALETHHRVFITKGDPAASVLAMERTWHAYFDFGELSTEKEDPNTVRFELNGFADVSLPHAMMIIGWHVAAARVAGSPDARHEVLAAPWNGAPRLIHRIHF
jgi:hypothetical protein